MLSAKKKKKKYKETGKSIKTDREVLKVLLTHSEKTCESQVAITSNSQGSSKWE